MSYKIISSALGPLVEYPTEDGGVAQCSLNDIPTLFALTVEFPQLMDDLMKSIVDNIKESTDEMLDAFESRFQFYPHKLHSYLTAIQSFDYFSLLLLPKFNDQIGSVEEQISMDNQGPISGGVGKLTLY
jgi:hypothetical protein